MTRLSFRNTRGWLIFFLDLIGLVTILWLTNLELRELPKEFSLAIFVFIFSLFIAGTYEKNIDTGSPKLPIRTFFTCLVAGSLLLVSLALFNAFSTNSNLNKGALILSTIQFGMISTLNRYFLNKLYRLSEKNKKILYIGYSARAEGFIKELATHSEARHIDVLTNQKKIIKSNFASKLNTQPNDALREKWHEIIIDPESDANDEQTSALVAQYLKGTPVLSLADYYERNWFMVQINNIGNGWFLRSQSFSRLTNQVSLRIKRVIDITLSSIALSISLPLIFISALLIKSTSRGPALFKQVRVGLEGREFTIFKLRTMLADAEIDGVQWAKHDDPRITLVGNYLRKSRLDELPQFWNVLRGDMSLVGPRPERPEFTEELAKIIPYYDLRHLVKPGITGWAQVIFPYGASEEDAIKKLQYELYYIKNQSLLLDLNIILRTLITVFQSTGR